jgi:beta-glucanase (GH16 family)
MKHYLLLAISYILSELLQWYFKIHWRFGLKESDYDITKNGAKWTDVNPFSGAPTKGELNTFYNDELCSHGEYSNSMIVSFKTENKNPVFWLLQLQMNKLQEIDVFETMVPNGVPGIYFSIYNNEESSDYYRISPTGENIPIYDRFQTRMRGIAMLAYLTTRKLEYKIKWTPEYVMWYIAGIPVAISFVYIPVQPMWLILNNLEE